jgi:hypothetical protein
MKLWPLAPARAFADLPVAILHCKQKLDDVSELNPAPLVPSGHYFQYMLQSSIDEVDFDLNLRGC